MLKCRIVAPFEPLESHNDRPEGERGEGVLKAEGVVVALRYPSALAAFAAPRPELPVSSGGNVPGSPSSFVAIPYRIRACTSSSFRPFRQSGSVMRAPAIALPVQELLSP
jgi:hypothetical protein